MKINVVSGYIPVPDVINVSEEKFRELGKALRDALPCRSTFFDGPASVLDTWLFRWLAQTPWRDDVVCSDPDPDTQRFGGDRFITKLMSNFVMHEKYSWLFRAMDEDQASDVFVWMDYGVLKQENMSPEVVTRFVERLQEMEVTKITAPGIRESADEPEPTQSWDRFCGSLVIVPRRYVLPLAALMQLDAMRTIEETKKVTIESNTLARVERQGHIPFHWYQSWWGASMFDALTVS